MKRITVDLPDAIAQDLLALAEKDKRHPRDQAAIYIERAVKLRAAAANEWRAELAERRRAHLQDVVEQNEWIRSNTKEALDA